MDPSPDNFARSLDTEHDREDELKKQRIAKLIEAKKAEWVKGRAAHMKKFQEHFAKVGEDRFDEQASTTAPADNSTTQSLVSSSSQLPTHPPTQSPIHPPTQLPRTAPTQVPQEKRSKEKRKRSDSPVNEIQRAIGSVALAGTRIPKKPRTESRSGSIDINSPFQDHRPSLASPPHDAQAVSSSANHVLPAWYTSISERQLMAFSKKRDNTTNQQLTALKGFRDIVRRCQNNPREKDKLFDELRDSLHKLEFILFDKLAIKKAHMLDTAGFGLPRIFDPRGDVGYTYDIRADAEQLYNRWAQEVFEVDLLRGIVLATVKGKANKRNADSIDKSFPGRQSAKFYGQGHLINGQWWPTQLCTVRDGAHGSAQGGIFGEKGKGTYSIILSGGHQYQDVDNGDDIWYSGTDSTNSTPTENTQRMIESVTTVKKPVRVLRSWNLHRDNIYRPECGMRYDGLYDVVDMQVIDKSKAIHRFRLIRCKGQDPIRYKGLERRPTEQEKEEYNKLRTSQRGVGSENW